MDFPWVNLVADETRFFGVSRIAYTGTLVFDKNTAPSICCYKLGSKMFELWLP